MTIVLSLRVNILIGVVAAFIYEHTARLNDWWRFSLLLNWLADQFVDLFYRCGRILSELSAFLTYIDLEQVLITAETLIRPLWRLFLSPGQLLIGYVKTAWEYAHPLWVYWGSGLIIAALYGIWYHFYGHPPWAAKIADWANDGRRQIFVVVRPGEDSPVCPSPLVDSNTSIRVANFIETALAEPGPVRTTRSRKATVVSE